MCKAPGEPCGNLNLEAVEMHGIVTKCDQRKAKHRLIKADGNPDNFEMPSTCVCTVVKDADMT